MRRILGRYIHQTFAFTWNEAPCNKAYNQEIKLTLAIGGNYIRKKRISHRWNYNYEVLSTGKRFGRKFRETAPYVITLDVPNQRFYSLGSPVRMIKFRGSRQLIPIISGKLRKLDEARWQVNPRFSS